MSSFICHFQPFPRAVISLTLSLSPEMPSDHWMRGWTQLSLFLSAARYSSCCCSGGRSRCVYLLCPPPFCSLITAVRQLCLGGSHSIVLAPPLTCRCSCGCWLRSARPNPWKGLSPNHCDTWHLGALSRLRLRLSVSFLPGQSLLQSLLQTAAILLLLVLPVCLPLLHSNQIVEPSLKCLQHLSPATVVLFHANPAFALTRHIPTPCLWTHFTAARTWKFLGVHYTLIVVIQ